jgi:peptidylprolyl isomerase
MFKPLFVLPFVAFALIAAKQAEAPVEQKPSINPPAEIAADPANRLNIELSNGGTVVIQLRPDVAPNHVRRIQELASSGFYNGTIFHRVIPGFMAQGGDPQGTGQGGSPLPDLAAEFNDLPHMRGVLSMARAEDENSANSQFFIMLAPSFGLDHKYTGLGRVVSGMQFVDGIAPGEPPAQPTKIVRAWLDGAAPRAMAVAPAQPPAPAPVPEAAQPQAVVGPAPAEQPAGEAPAASTDVPAAEAPAPAEQPAGEAPAASTDVPAAEAPAAAAEPQAEVPAEPAEEPKDEPQGSPTGG